MCESGVEIREEKINAKISQLLADPKCAKFKEDISNFFLRDLLYYLREIIKIASCVTDKSRYSEQIEHKFADLNNQILLKGYCLEEIIEEKMIINKVKDNFRALAGPFAYESPIVKRAFEKPRGYPGDYLMLEIVYDNKPFAEQRIGLCFDKYFLGNPYAVAVRYRKDRLCEILKEEILRFKKPVMKIFDIACGSCRELIELPQEIFKDKKEVIFTCLDWDEEALDFSRKAVKNMPKNVKFNFVKQDIMDMIKDRSPKHSFEKQDVIYSIGLIDYLPDRVLKSLVEFFYGLVEHNGKLILTHKNKEKTFSPLPPDWFCNWKFVPRTKEEVTKLFYTCGLKNFASATKVDMFNDIFYFTFVKE